MSNCILGLNARNIVNRNEFLNLGQEIYENCSFKRLREIESKHFFLNGINVIHLSSL